VLVRVDTVARSLTAVVIVEPIDLAQLLACYDKV
jgi:hypothetical protein